MENTDKRLLKQPELGAKYYKIIDDYIKKGYLENANTNKGTDNRWFLTNFPIICPDKSTTKVTIVCDGSAKCGGKSLNDIIHQGPKIQQD